MDHSKRLLIVVNQMAFFKSHRLPLAIAAQGAGYEVHIATAPSADAGDLAEMGLTHHALPLRRSGLNPIPDLVFFAYLLVLFIRVRPRVLHLVTSKPVIYGGIAARLLRIPRVVMAISGLGFVFTQNNGSSKLLRGVVQFLYRLAVKGSRVRVIFQNRDDRRAFLAFSGLQAHQAVLIPGAGVALAQYQPRPEPGSPVTVVMAARLLVDKGVFEFVTAARQLRQQGVQARFCLAGAPDPENPSACTDQDIQTWRKEGVVEILGHCADIAGLFARSHIVVLPSYREGMPKVLLEAAACGRPVVTTDVPGCREAIEPGVTGLLVPPRDSHSLASAIGTLISDPVTRRAMGAAGRRKAEREFALESVIETHLQLYGEGDGGA